MSQSKKSKPAGRPTSVSKQPAERLRAEEAELIVGKPVSVEPAQGTESKRKSPRSSMLQEQGVEDVEPVVAAPDTSKLRDIGEASFGRGGFEIVFSPDDRIQITNTGVYPWRVHASLLITANDNSQWIGTAFFIGPHTLMTAGHCVFIKNSGVPNRDGWVKSIVVMPGRNGSYLPYGSITVTNTIRTNNFWADSGDANYDYGAIILPTDLGNTTGWLGFGIYSDSDLVSSYGNISGYPGDKTTGTQWYNSRQIASVDSRLVYYTIDTYGGQSGSAVYRIINGDRYGVAIHTWGDVTSNHGVRIVQDLYNLMLEWRA